MSIAEIEKTKLELIDWIKDMSDLEMLHALEELKDTKQKNWWSELSPSHQQSVLRGLEQAKNGEGTSSKEFWERVKR